MRMSRRSVIHTYKGVRWQKWNCTKSSTQYYDISAGTIIGSGVLDSPRNGYTSYNFDTSTGQFSNAGSYVSIPVGASGTYYEAFGSTLFVLSISSGSYYEYSYSALGPYTSYSYTKGSEVGYVYAASDAYPDAIAGYVYDGTFSSGGITYTVMRSGSTYYCYNVA
jgi:hypothetical protein